MSADERSGSSPTPAPSPTAACGPSAPDPGPDAPAGPEGEHPGDEQADDVDRQLDRGALHLRPLPGHEGDADVGGGRDGGDGDEHADQAPGPWEGHGESAGDPGQEG